MDAVKLGKAIKALRKKQGITQLELANLIGVTDKAVSKWERGIGAPDISMISRLASELSTDADILLDGNVNFLEDSWNGVLVLGEQYAGSMVYSKPSVYFPLCYFMLAGIRKITVYCSEESAQFLTERFGDGSRIGLELHYKPNEGCRKVRLSRTMVIFGTPFVYGNYLTREFQHAVSAHQKISVLTIHEQIGKDLKNPEWYLDSMKAAEYKMQLYRNILPVYFVRSEVSVPQLTEESMLDLLIRAAAQRQMNVEAMGRGMVYSRMGSDDELLDVAMLIRILERLSQMQIYSVEEVAKNRNLH